LQNHKPTRVLYVTVSLVALFQQKVIQRQYILHVTVHTYSSVLLSRNYLEFETTKLRLNIFLSFMFWNMSTYTQSSYRTNEANIGRHAHFDTTRNSTQWCSTQRGSTVYIFSYWSIA